MIEIINEFFSKIGIPGIGAAIIIFFMKNNPITSISASTIEMKLATKEKRLYVKIVKFTVEILIYTLMLMNITITFFSDKDLFNFNLALITSIILVGIFIWILIMNFKEISFSDLVRDYEEIYKWLLYIFFILHFISMFIFIAYVIGTQLYSSYLDDTIPQNERYAILIGIIIFYFFIVVVLHFIVLDTYYNFIGLKNNNKYTLTLNIGGETWYLFHPIDREIYLLGNKSNVQECTQFCFMERTELLKEIIEVKK